MRILAIILAIYVSFNFYFLAIILFFTKHFMASVASACISALSVLLYRFIKNWWENGF